MRVNHGTLVKHSAGAQAAIDTWLRDPPNIGAPLRGRSKHANGVAKARAGLVRACRGLGKLQIISFMG